jgi:hypothetical protein
MGSPIVLPTFQVKPTPLLRWVLQMPSIDPTEVPLFASSVCIFVAQAHLLLPPPLSRHRSPSPLAHRAQGVNWPIYHVPNIVSRLTPIKCEIECIPHSLRSIADHGTRCFVCQGRLEGLPPKTLVFFIVDAARVNLISTSVKP